MNNVHKINFPLNLDKYGHLVHIEEINDIPFRLKRIYYIYGVSKKARRGFHSHKKLEQILVCVSGKVKILVKTPYSKKIITLNKPTEGLYIGPMIWREMFDFSPDAVLLVLASEHYKPKDYIRDYSVYCREAKKYFSKF